VAATCIDRSNRTAGGFQETPHPNFNLEKRSGQTADRGF